MTIKRVFCWLPRKVYQSFYWQDGFRWLTWAYVNGDGRLYSRVSYAERALDCKPVRITVGPASRVELTVIGGGGGGGRCTRSSGGNGGGWHSSDNIGEPWPGSSGGSGSPVLIAPANVEAAIDKILKSPGDASSTQRALINLILKLANGQEI